MQFHETVQGKRFFEGTLPHLIKAIEKSTQAALKHNELLEQMISAQNRKNAPETPISAKENGFTYAEWNASTQKVIERMIEYGDSFSDEELSALRHARAALDAPLRSFVEVETELRVNEMLFERLEEKYGGIEDTAGLVDFLIEELYKSSDVLLDYHGDMRSAEDGCVVVWVCRGCGAHGLANYKYAFDHHSCVEDCDGCRIGRGEDAGK